MSTSESVGSPASGEDDDALPSVADVASRLRARTRPAVIAEGVTDTGTFTEYTRPTAAQVQDIIERSARWVYSVLGDTSTLEAGSSMMLLVRDLVGLHAAMEVELSYWPEQTRDDQSVYARLSTQYDVGLGNVQTALREQASGSHGVGNAVLPAASGLDGCALPPGFREVTIRWPGRIVVEGSEV